MIYKIAMICPDDMHRYHMRQRIEKRFQLASVKATYTEFKDVDDFDNHEHFDVILADCDEVHDYVALSQAWFQVHHSHIVLMVKWISTQHQLQSLIYVITQLKEYYPTQFEKLIDQILLNLYLNNYVKLIPTVDGSNKRLLLRDILYIEHQGETSLIHTLQETIISNASLNQILTDFNAYQLCCINPTVAVNWLHIRNLSRQYVFMDNDVSLPIAYRKFRKVHASFCLFCGMPV